MNRRLLAALGGTLLAAALALASFGTAMAQTPAPGGPGGGPGWGPCGTTGGAYGGGNWGMGPGMMGGWGTTAPADGQAALTLDDAQQAVQNYLNQYGDPNLKIDEVMEFQYNFYAIVQEKDTGKGAMELLVNKSNGAVFPEYGPNMMWNTKYGMMGGFGGMMGGGWYGTPQGQNQVTAEQARSIAQKWLDANQPGSTTEEPDAFYGYYTVHTLKDGTISGMLSINEYTGQVWYHTWHGTFIASKEAGD